MLPIYISRKTKKTANNLLKASGSFLSSMLLAYLMLCGTIVVIWIATAIKALFK